MIRLGLNSLEDSASLAHHHAPAPFAHLPLGRWKKPRNRIIFSQIVVTPSSPFTCNAPCRAIREIMNRFSHSIVYNIARVRARTVPQTEEQASALRLCVRFHIPALSQFGLHCSRRHAAAAPRPANNFPQTPMIAFFGKLFPAIRPCDCGLEPSFLGFSRFDS